MAQLRSTGKGRLSKYTSGIVEILQKSFENGQAVFFGSNQHIVKNNQNNKQSLQQYVDLISVGKEKEALKLTLEIETKGRPQITFGSLSKPKDNHNLGDIAEGILAIVLHTKLYYQREIIYDDISPNIEYPNLVIKLSKTNLEFLKNPNNLNYLKPIINSCIRYVNSIQLPDYKKFYVVADGISEQTSNKSDVYVVCDDTKILNLSLKLGDVKQFGQISGSAFDKQQELWKKLFDLDISFLQCLYDDTDVVASSNLIYSFVTHSFNVLKPIKELTNGIDYFATRNDRSILLLQLKTEKNVYLFDFHNIYDRMKSVNLKAFFEVNKQLKPKVQIGNILTVRLKTETNVNGLLYVRNYVEKELGLNEMVGKKI